MAKKNKADGETPAIDENEGSMKTKDMVILPPNFVVGQFEIEGTSPFVQNKWSKKSREEMRKKQEAGSQNAKGKKREAKDFQAAYEGSIHKFEDGGCGIPAPAFRNAMISACRICGFKMTQAKMCLFIEADGVDREDGTPLVRFTRGEPEYLESTVRNASGVVDLRARAMWREGWRAMLRISFDADQFSMTDVGNLLMRAGLQVGVGEGRPDSKKSCGMGWGLFRPLERTVATK
jgi:hypothetical protein